MKKILFCFLLIFTKAIAQLPNTDIWLVDITSFEDGNILFSNPVNITNQIGYDNQPSFSPDGSSIFYTSMRDGKQTDICKYELKTKSTSQFTKTATSEYSPNVTPDGKNVSVVMVEPDSTQRLWKFSMNGGKPSVFVKEVDSIGYYCWFYGKRAAVYLLTEPASLQLISKDAPKPKHVDNNVGRCLSYYNGMLYYTVKTREGLNQFCFFNLPGWYIKKTNVAIESEDYAFRGERVIYGIDNKLYSTVLLDGNDEKKLIKDFSELGIKNITRIAISPDGTKMAFVTESK